MFWLYGPLIIVLYNRDYNIDQNNRDYDFCHNRAALMWSLFSEVPERDEAVDLSRVVLSKVPTSIPFGTEILKTSISR